MLVISGFKHILLSWNYKHGGNVAAADNAKDGDGNRHANEPSGRVRSGLARAAALSPEQRSEIARDAAISRWRKDLPRAIATGDLPIGGIKIACAVLDDEKNTRVLTQDGFLVAIGRSKRPSSSAALSVLDETPAFLRAANLQAFVSKNIRCSTTPIRFRSLKGGGMEGVALGYEADLLPEVCWVYHDAAVAEKLLSSQRHIAEYCGALLRGLTNVAITALVDEATGYQEIRDKQALQAILDQYLRKTLAAWAKCFPDEFYYHIARLRGWEWRGRKFNPPQIVAYYTNDFVYHRLAPGLVEELDRKNPVIAGRRRATNTQWLTEEVGHPALAQHLHAVIALMRASSDWGQLRSMLDIALPRQEKTVNLPIFREMAAVEEKAKAKSESDLPLFSRLDPPGA